MLLIAADVPSLPLAPSPTPPLNVLPAPLPQAPSDAASRYFWKLSVVPDSSLRKTTLIGSPGKCPPEFSALISGSFHVVTAPLKIFAAVGPSSTSAVDAGDVVGDRDRTEDRRQVPCGVARSAAPALSTFALLGAQRRVGATEVGLAADELGHTGTRTARGVVQGVAGAGGLVGGDEPGHRVGLRGASRWPSGLSCRRTRPWPRSRRRSRYHSRGASAAAARVVVAAAGRKQSAPAAECSRSTESVGLT